MSLRALSSVYGEIQEILILCPASERKEFEKLLEEGGCLHHWKTSQEVALCPMYTPDEGPEGKGGNDVESQKVEDIWNYYNQYGLDREISRESAPHEYLNALDAIGEFGKLGQLAKQYEAYGIPFIPNGWAQDPFVVLRRNRCEEVLLQSVFLEHRPDFFVSILLPGLLKREMLIKPTSLHLEGGNILVGDDYALMGKDLLAANLVAVPNFSKDAEMAKGTLRSLVKHLEDALGVKKIHFVGTKEHRERNGVHTSQPIFHIDCFLTLGGKNKAGEEVIFMGDPGWTWNKLQAAGLVDEVEDWEFNPLPKYVADFEEIGNYLNTLAGFQVEKFPLLYREEKYMSFNNCLVEVYQNGEGKEIKNAFLPDYRGGPLATEKLDAILTKLNGMAEEILNRNGFDQVQFLDCDGLFSEKSMQNGSLHCMTKVLRRSSYSKP